MWRSWLLVLAAVAVSHATDDIAIAEQHEAPLPSRAGEEAVPDKLIGGLVGGTVGALKAPIGKKAAVSAEKKVLNGVVQKLEKKAAIRKLPEMSCSAKGMVGFAKAAVMPQNGTRTAKGVAIRGRWWSCFCNKCKCRENPNPRKRSTFTCDGCTEGNKTGVVSTSFFRAVADGLVAQREYLIASNGMYMKYFNARQEAKAEFAKTEVGKKQLADKALCQRLPRRPTHEVEDDKLGEISQVGWGGRRRSRRSWSRRHRFRRTRFALERRSKAARAARARAARARAARARAAQPPRATTNKHGNKGVRGTMKGGAKKWDCGMGIADRAMKGGASIPLQANGCQPSGVMKAGFCWTKGCLNPGHPSVPTGKFRVPKGMEYALTPKFIAKHEAAIKKRIRTYIIDDWKESAKKVVNTLLMTRFKKMPDSGGVVRVKKVTTRLDQWCVGKRQSDQVPVQGAVAKRMPLLKASAVVEFTINGFPGRHPKLVSVYCTAHCKVSSAKQFDKLPLIDTYCFVDRKGGYMNLGNNFALHQHFLRTGEEKFQVPLLAQQIINKAGSGNMDTTKVRKLVACVRSPSCANRLRKAHCRPRARRVGRKLLGKGLLAKLVRKAANDRRKKVHESTTMDVVEAAIRLSIADLRPHMVN
jgi:hypothetical protein